MLFDITSTPAQPYESVCSIDHYNMHISLCICNFGNKLSNIGQVFSDNHWKYGLYFDIATSPVSNEHSSILYCIMINQQAVLNMNSQWIICRNSYSTRTLYMYNYISFIDYFPDNFCLVMIDFSANTDWTLKEALIYIFVFFVNCIFCVASECAGI